MDSEEDKSYIRRCFELAARGTGNVSPNPLVGSVIVKDGKILSEGYHREFGSMHAEFDAITNSIESVQNATLYCNLEPCCHTDKNTPPCVPLIVKSGITKVVISNFDPNPKVAGKGVEQLKIAGVKVESGVLSDEGKELNRFFFKFISRKLPYISLKIAQSIDRKIAADDYIQTWLTGKESDKFVHAQRAIYDAVLVGAGTINIDNPQLNVRHVKGRNPVRVIVDGNLSIKIESISLNDPERTNTWVFVSENIRGDKLNKLLDKGVKIIFAPSDENNIIELKFILEKLAEENIVSLLVEGGKSIFSGFISQNLFDEIIFIQSPKILGKGIAAFDNVDEIALELYSVEVLGQDLKSVYKKFSGD
jgi:diaminohydroxyphosphoribosylaminopyrimidine deaminase/5-amino-6-(5-phosphoribosylamino)uracil reductase